MHIRKITLFLSAFLLASLLVMAQTHTAKQPPVLDVSSMDKSVGPCVDFYSYSCGGWIKKNPIPPDQANWGTYGKLEDDNRTQLRTILEEAAKTNGSRDAVKNDVTHDVTQKIGDYYASCMDEAAIEKLG